MGDATDYLLQAAVGALEGFDKVYLPRKQAELEDAMSRRRKKQELEDELSIYKEKLPLEIQSKYQEELQKSGIETRAGIEKKKAELDYRQPLEMDLIRLKAEEERKTNSLKPKDFKIQNDLRREFIDRPEVKEFININTSVKSMDALLKKTLSGDKKNQVALDQALVTLYNKLTDPQSVVRESEYARTAENLPLINRITGAIGKIEQGGAGLTDDDRKSLVIGAKIIGNERGAQFKRAKESYSKLSNQYQVDPSLVTGVLPDFEPYSINEYGVKNSRKPLNSFYK